MTEILTAADIGQIVGYFAASFAFGFVGGRIQRYFVQIADKL